MKNVVISGGSSGIGLAAVNHFSQAGWQTFVLDIQPLLKKIPNSHFIACDVSKIIEIQNAVKNIASTCHPIDALVCNAGIHFSSRLLETSETDYNHVMDTNFKSAFFLTQAILPLMISAKKGSIVFVGSDQALIGKCNSAIYGATKAALGSLAKTTALDYAKYGIRANTIAAGTIDSPLYQRAIEKYCDRTNSDSQEIHELEAKEQPLGRIGNPEEVANLIYFLCSDEASFMTGGIIPIDGGYTAK